MTDLYVAIDHAEGILIHYRRASTTLDALVDLTRDVADRPREAIESGARYHVYRVDDHEGIARYLARISDGVDVADYGGVLVGVIDGAALAAWCDAEREDDMRAYFEAA